jgi:hypothetical protein
MPFDAIKLNMAFADGSNETLNAVVSEGMPGPTLSKHYSPRAGFEMEGTYASPRLILLVQAPPLVAYYSG